MLLIPEISSWWLPDCSLKLHCTNNRVSTHMWHWMIPSECPATNHSPVDHLEESKKKKVRPNQHRLFLSGIARLIQSVTFEKEREPGPAWSSLVPLWLQFRVRTRPIVTLDQMASINTFNQGSLVSAQSCTQTQSGSPAQPYSNHRPAATLPPNATVTFPRPRYCRLTNRARAAAEYLHISFRFIFLPDPEAC